MALTHRKRSSTMVAVPDVLDETGLPGADARPPVAGSDPAAALTEERATHTDGVDVGARAPEETIAALTLGEEFGGSRLLLSDLRTALLLSNQVRLRVIARLFGVGPAEANLLTLVAMLTAAGAAQAKVHRLLERPHVPSAGDGLLTGSLLREVVGAAAGPSARDTPYLGTLLSIAIVGGTAGPAAVRSARALRTASHRSAVAFHHRYGYIVDPGHWRERRAHKGAAESLRPPAAAPTGVGFGPDA